MNRASLFCVFVLLLGSIGQSVSYAQEKAAQEEPPIDPRAESLIREMSERAKSNEHFRFVVLDTIDEVQESGQKLQFTHQRFGTVSRPDKLKVRSVGDLRNRTIWKDGETITILDEDHNVYVQIEDPGTIDDMMDLLLERYGMTTPLADLLSSDLYGVLMGKVETGEYVGLHYAGEIECHHLAFTQEEIDWQIWVDAGGQPSLRKLVITYKQLPGEPQYTLRLQSYTSLAEEPRAEFQYELPPEADRIEVRPIEAPETDETSPGE
jgi:hypothetical protein